MATLNRNYAGKDVEMLTTCATIIEQAINHKAFLTSKRATWADPFLPDLQTRIQNAFSTYLGIDNAQQMRQATQLVVGIQKNAIDSLAEFKVQVTEDFKKDKPFVKELLTNLGFTQNLKDAQKNSQEALIQLLLTFKQNISTALQTKIEAAGTPTALINTIVGYADALNNANITQETLKGSRKVISQAGVTEFNEIYNQVISVAKIAATLYKGDAAVKDKFSYAKTLRTITKATSTVPPKTS